MGFTGNKTQYGTLRPPDNHHCQHPGTQLRTPIPLNERLWIITLTLTLFVILTEGSSEADAVAEGSIPTALIAFHGRRIDPSALLRAAQDDIWWCRRLRWNVIP